MRLGLLQWLEQYKVDRQQEVAALKRKVLLSKGANIPAHDLSSMSHSYHASSVLGQAASSASP